jgi:hypothetical protein
VPGKSSWSVKLASGAEAKNSPYIFRYKATGTTSHLTFTKWILSVKPIKMGSQEHFHDFFKQKHMRVKGIETTSSSCIQC